MRWSLKSSPFRSTKTLKACREFPGVCRRPGITAAIVLVPTPIASDVTEDTSGLEIPTLPFRRPGNTGAGFLASGFMAFLVACLGDDGLFYLFFYFYLHARRREVDCRLACTKRLREHLHSVIAAFQG